MNNEKEIAYINNLFFKGDEAKKGNKHNAKRIKIANQYYKKARSALEYFFISNNEVILSTTKWANRWDISTETALKWIREFKEQ